MSGTWQDVIKRRWKGRIQNERFLCVGTAGFFLSVVFVMFLVLGGVVL